MRGIAVALFTLSVTTAALLAPAREKWLFAMNTFAEDEEVTMVSNLVARAQAVGMNGLCLLSGEGYTGWISKARSRHDLPTKEWISNHCGLESYDLWNEPRKARFQAVRRYAESVGVEVVPLVWSLGYFSARYEEPNAVAVVPVKDVEATVRDGRIVCAARPLDIPVEAPGATCENGVWTFDIKKMHAVTKTGMARGSVKIRTKPYRRYRVSLKIRTENFGPVNEEPRWPSLCFSVSDGVCSGGSSRLRPTENMDWRPFSSEINSLHHNTVTLYFGVWGENAYGKVLFKDIVVEAVGIDSPVRREGTTLAVRDAETGRTYAEGRDYAAVPPLAALNWEAQVDPLAIRTLPGGALAEGTRVLVSVYEPFRARGTQFSGCPSWAGMKTYLAKSARNVRAATGARKWLLSADEIRSECLCERCRSRKTDMAHKIAAALHEQVDAIHAVSPDAVVYAWCDMLNPFDNPRNPHYYNCLTTWQGIWDLMPGPDRLRMVYWGEKPKQKEIEFLTGCGYRGMAAGYYDYDPELKQPAKWVNEMNARAGAFDGWMYTTWEWKYDQIEDYAKIFNVGLAD